MSAARKRIRRRHRADLRGFTIVFHSAENPEPLEGIAAALAEAFWAWRETPEGRAYREGLKKARTAGEDIRLLRRL